MTILLYHRVARLARHCDPHGLAVTPEQFEQQMRALHRWDVRCASLPEVVGRWAAQQRPDDQVALTFDDGYEEFYTTAWPVLERYGLTATVFLVVDCLGRDSGWAGQGAHRSAPLLTWEQVRELAAHGITLGSHTLTHPHLSTLARDEARREICVSRDILQDRLGVEVSLFSYPYSDRAPEIARLVEESGYRAACAADQGAWGLFNLWRAQIGCHDNALTFAFKASAWHRRMLWLREETRLGLALHHVARPVRRLVAREAISSDRAATASSARGREHEHS